MNRVWAPPHHLSLPMRVDHEKHLEQLRVCSKGHEGVSHHDYCDCCHCWWWSHHWRKGLGAPAAPTPQTHTLGPATSALSQSWKGPREIYHPDLHFSLDIRYGWLLTRVVGNKFLNREFLDTRTWLHINPSVKPFPICSHSAHHKHCIPCGSMALPR